jgi:hypothetical protein
MNKNWGKRAVFILLGFLGMVWVAALWINGAIDESLIQATC